MKLVFRRWPGKDEEFLDDEPSACYDIDNIKFISFHRVLKFDTKRSLHVCDIIGKMMNGVEIILAKYEWLPEDDHQYCQKEVEKIYKDFLYWLANKNDPKLIFNFNNLIE